MSNTPYTTTDALSTVVGPNPIVGQAGDTLGHFGATGATIQTVAGASGATGVIGALCTALAAYGLIIEG